MEVHRELGPGFVEPVYAQAFVIELQSRGIPYMTEVPFPVLYKRHTLPAHYRADFVCFEAIVVELKAASAKTGGIERAQMINYLRASGMPHGLLFNFGTPRLEYRRFILSRTEPLASETSEPNS